MANEYKCDICGNAATVHITKIIDGKKVKIHLCSSCAEKASFDAVNLPLDIFPKLKELEKMMSKKITNPDSCLTCGASLAEIEKGARFSCPDCYVALGNRLLEIFAQMHAATEHKGKSPKTHAPNCSVSLDLSKKLRDFEDIANEEIFEENLESALADLVSTVDNDIGEADVNKSDSNSKSKSPKNKAKSAKKVAEEEDEQSLKKALDIAISEERYEDAANLRDKLKILSERQK